MFRPRHLILALFATWNLVVWGFRLTTIGDDPDTSPDENMVLAGLAMSHVICGLIVVGVLVAMRRGSSWPWAARATAGVAAWTVGSWTVRLVAILSGDHEVAFVIVHAVLAMISCTLAVASWQLVTRMEIPDASPAVV